MHGAKAIYIYYTHPYNIVKIKKRFAVDRDLQNLIALHYTILEIKSKKIKYQNNKRII